MMNVLKTSLYNKFYYDFLKATDGTLKYLLPYTPDAISDVCRAIAAGSDVHRQMKEVLAQQNLNYQSAKAKDYLSQLADPNSMIIITGQQLGFLLTPIYTIYKAITTVKLAEHMNGLNTGFRFIPVFWLETEDHDFEEIRHAGIWDRNMKPLLISYAGQDRLRTSIRHYELDDKIVEAVTKIQQEMLESEFTERLFSRLRDHYRTGRSWIDATLDLFRELFADSGLLFFEPGTADVKKIGGAFFEQWLIHIGKVNASFSRLTSRLELDGYPAQVPDIPGKSFLHFEDEMLQRQHIYHENGNYYLKDRPEKWSQDGLIKILRSEPQRFSTAVASRPPLQSWLLPVAGYVAGPAEIAYWAQLRDIFNVMNIPFPVVYPRLSATLIEPKIARFIDKHHADISHAPLKMKDFVDTYFAQNQMDTDRFKQWRSTIESTFSEITDYIKKVDPTLVPVAAKTGQRIEGQVEQLENRLLQAVEQKEQTLISHLEQIHTAIFPLEQPQERFVSVVYYLNKYGSDFVNRLIENLELDPKQHQILNL